MLKEDGIALGGLVEADEAYVGGRTKGLGRGVHAKTPVSGMLERGGSVIATVVENTTAETLLPKLEKHVMPQSTIVTDEWNAYRRVKHLDFKHETVHHKSKEYVREIFHTNSIEGFWSQLKRSINGTFHHVSRKHLQKYVSEFSYRYNRRKSETPMFLHLVADVAAQHGAAV